LVRTRVGSFDLCDAWTLSELAEAPLSDEWERIALAPDATAQTLDAVIVDASSVRSWEQGKRWKVDATGVPRMVRVYDSAGNWLGIGEIADTSGHRELRPRKVVPLAVSLEGSP
jgi:tRNA U55 pseudouridine synthase TruB